MPPAFSKDEYESRLATVHKRMEYKNLDALFVTDPANINWLTGYDSWSFYVPQAMLVEASGAPIWIGREMDAGAANFTTYLHDSCIIAVPEDYVQREDVHPGDFMGEQIAARGHNGKRIGYESDGYFLSPKWLNRVQVKLPDSKFIDADLLINWCRLQKSPAEIDCMQVAANIAGNAMQAAFDNLQTGVRQSDLMSKCVSAQIRGDGEKCGHLTAIYPLLLAGEKASTAHPMWDDSVLMQDQTIAFELGGCRNRYNAGLARTAHLGKPPSRLIDTASAVNEGLESVLDVLQAGVAASDVHAAWQKVLNKYGLEKKSRIGYSIGIGYAPDWGERTLSLRSGERTEVSENTVLHIILGMWMDGWGMELSETVQVKSGGCKSLTHFPRDIYQVG